jgi:hypothetical protein
MAVTVKFDWEEIERLLREEVARKYNSEVTDVDFCNVDDEYIEVTLGGPMSAKWGDGPGDR